MKNIYLFSQDKIEKRWFKYPCVDTNSKFLSERKICVFGDTDQFRYSILEEFGAKLIINPENKECSFTNGGIILPPKTEKKGKELYFEILDYYIQILKLLTHKQKSVEGYKHIIVFLPEESNKCSVDFDRLAFFAVYGLIKGLGMQYAPNGLFINGIMSSNYNEERTFNYIRFLLSDNSCNIVGQIFELR